MAVLAPMQSFESPPITEKILVCVEGRGDQGLIGAVFRLMGFDDVYIRDMNGRTKWNSYLPALAKEDGFLDRTRAVGLVQDADMNRQGAWQRCTGALAASGLPIPNQENTVATDGVRSSAILILPDDGAEGMLEDLCLAWLPDDVRTAHLWTYVESVDALSPLQARSKSAIAAYLSCLPNCIPSVRVGFDHDIFDVAHVAFQRAREFAKCLTDSLAAFPA